MAWAEGRFIARNKQIGREAIELYIKAECPVPFFLTNFDFSLYTTKLKENF
jgi:hypothetical protein